MHGLLSRDEVGTMFDAVAPRYDVLNRVLSLGVDRGWRVEAIRALELRPGDVLADICGGTGELAFEAERQTPGVNVVNIDLSGPMLHGHRRRAESRARGRTAAAGAGANGAVGDAMCLPLKSGVAQGAVIGFGIRNVPDRLAALREAQRVLEPGGRLVVLEFGLPSRRPVRTPYLFYLRRVVPRVAAALSPAPEAYRYLGDSILAFPPPAEFAQLLSRAGFAAVGWRTLSFGIAVRYLAVKEGSTAPDPDRAARLAAGTPAAIC
jgi:demethylmenaquinone methyltransferase / 2-methoxy-6-polyprenyl-1,4-benzoquinol methylase